MIADKKSTMMEVKHSRTVHQHLETLGGETYVFTHHIPPRKQLILRLKKNTRAVKNTPTVTPAVLAVADDVVQGFAGDVEGDGFAEAVACVFAGGHVGLL